MRKAIRDFLKMHVLDRFYAIRRSGIWRVGLQELLVVCPVVRHVRNIIFSAQCVYDCIWPNAEGKSAARSSFQKVVQRAASEEDTCTYVHSAASGLTNTLEVNIRLTTQSRSSGKGLES